MDGELGGVSGTGSPRVPGGLWSVAFTSGFTLLAGLLVGYYGGRWLDKLAGTTPWLSLVGIILGIVAGFRVLLRDILREGSAADQRGSPGTSGRTPDAGSSNDAGKDRTSERG